MAIMKVGYESMWIELKQKASIIKSKSRYQCDFHKKDSKEEANIDMETEN